MKRTYGWTWCWPGLSQLWWEGDWRGLVAALAFAALFNSLLICSLVWPELVAPRLVGCGWLLATGSWCLAVWFARPTGSPDLAAAAAGEDLFRAAQHEYLKGHWLEAQTLLERLLRVQREDVDARLLWATLLRRTGRSSQAERELRLLERLEGAHKWWLEIEAERRLLEKKEPILSLTGDEGEADGELAGEQGLRRAA